MKKAIVDLAQLRECYYYTIILFRIPQRPSCAPRNDNSVFEIIVRADR